MDASRVYVGAWALGCLYSHIYPNLSQGADRVGGQLRGDKECPFSGVTKSGRVWRNVPESGARSVVVVMLVKLSTKTHSAAPQLLVTSVSCTATVHHFDFG